MSEKSCGGCSRKIVSSNKVFKEDVLRNGKHWCGACVEGVKYIYYPEQTEYYEHSSRVFRKKPELVPCSPPWTTWSGTLLCEEDSDLGRLIRTEDPNAEDGYLFVDRKKVMQPGKVRGLWTAPCYKLSVSEQKQQL